MTDTMTCFVCGKERPDDELNICGICGTGFCDDCVPALACQCDVDAYLEAETPEKWDREELTALLRQSLQAPAN